MVKGLGDIMKQAQKIQSKMAQIQEEMAQKTIESSVGGGMVKAVANGKQELLSITIDPEIFKSGDAEILEDLIVAAVNDAIKRSQEMVTQEISKITGGLKIPGFV
jgi:DNA-binding YbaB/EbfC family protein